MTLIKRLSSYYIDSVANKLKLLVVQRLIIDKAKNILSENI